jgi:hypothetical protein
MPNQLASFTDEFSEYYETEYTGGNGKLASVMLANENEQYSPKPISNPSHRRK